VSVNFTLLVAIGYIPIHLTFSIKDLAFPSDRTYHFVFYGAIGPVREIVMNRRITAATAISALLLASSPAFAIDPKAPTVQRTSAVSSAQAEDGGRKVAGVGGIFGCSADGSKQEIGAVAGGLLGGFLGNRVAGRGNRTLGTILGGALGAAAGSALGCKLQKNDRDKAERAVEQAVLTGKDQSWSNPETGASGSVAVDADLARAGLANIKMAPDVEPASGYTSIGAAYVASSTVNIRSAPGTNAAVLNRLAPGQRVWVPAQVTGQPWLLVSDGGVAQGYVSAPLMKRAVAAQVAANNCRVVTQTVNVPGEGAQSEKLQACKGSDGNWSMTRV
jgi:surface antigen